MAVLAFGLIGSAIGSSLAAGTALAAIGGSLGYSIGSALGGRLFGPKQQDQHLSQTPLEGAQFVSVPYGEFIPYSDGATRLAGNVLWMSAIRQIPHTTTQESGGKGGGGGSTQSYTSYTSEIDILLAVAHHGDGAPPVGIRRFWYNSKLMYNVSSDADSDTLFASSNSSNWSRFTFYDGNPAQLPDPDYEAAVTDAPAYRGLSTVFIKSFQLGESNQIGNFQFELVREGAFGEIDNNIAYQTEYIFKLPGNLYFIGKDDSFKIVDASLNIVHEHSYGFNTTRSYCQDENHHIYFCRPLDDRVCRVSAVDYSVYVVTITDCWSLSIQDGVLTIGGNDTVKTVNCDSNLLSPTTFSTPNAYCRAINRSGIDYYLLSALTNKLSRYQFIAGALVHQLTYSYTHTILAGVNYVFPAFYRYDASSLYLYDTVKITQIGALDESVISTIDGVLNSKKTLFGNKIYYKSAAGIAKFDISTEVNEMENAEAYSIYAPDPPVIIYETGGVTHSNFSADIGTVTPPTIDDCVTRVMEYCGVAASKYDVTALASITKLVHGFHSVGVTSGRSLLEMLMQSHNFGARCSDKIYFYPIASSSVRTFDFSEFGAGIDSSEEDPFSLQQGDDIGRGASYSVTYPCLSNDYNTDTRSTSRTVAISNNTIDVIDLAVVMTPEQAQGVADTMALTSLAGRYAASVSVFGEHDDIEPGDVVTATDNAGRLHRMRVIKTSSQWPVFKIDLVIDDAGAIRATGTATDDFSPDNSLTPLAITELSMLDIPLISDVYETSGIGYGVAGSGDTSNWPGCSVLQSHNDTTYSQISTIGEIAIIGATTTILPAGIDNGALDISSAVTVSINKAATGSTYDDILDSATTGLWLIGSELIQVINVALVSSGIYTLHGMLRGRFGTEWAMPTHIVGERVVKIQPSGLRFKDMPVSRLNQSMFYKGVTAGQASSSVTPITFANTGVCKKPLSPVHATAMQSGSDIVIIWQRRTRMEHRLVGGLYLPLGETSEAYEVDIYDGLAVVRTLTGSIQSVTYTEAQQIADFGIEQDFVSFRIYQISAVVGRGYALIGAIQVVGLGHAQWDGGASIWDGGASIWD